MPRSITHKRQRTLDRWTEMLRQRFASLSGPQVAVLALWSIGIVLARSASLHAVVLSLSFWLPFNRLSLRKRLQEWYLEATAKKGHGSGATGVQRRDWDAQAASADLLRWILDDWPSRQLVLALDPTNFGDRFIVLNVSILYRGCAVPVIWTVVEGGKPEAWEPHWEGMLRHLAKQVPAGWQILVLTDRGLYSPRLFRCLRELDWHPFLRIRAQGFYRPVGEHKWLDLKDLRPENGHTQAFAAEIFKNDPGRLEATLVAYQGEAYAEPWLIVTDLTPELARASWYGLRGWIEQGYKRVKGEGWNLQRTRIASCARLERLWLAVALATLWVLEVGGEDEVEEQQRTPTAQAAKQAGQDTPALPDLCPPEPSPTEPTAAADRPGRTKKAPSTGRLWSVFGRGWNLLRNALAVGTLLLASWHPEPWPDHPAAGLPPTEAACAANVAEARADQPPGDTANNCKHRNDSS